MFPQCVHGWQRIPSLSVTVAIVYCLCSVTCHLVCMFVSRVTSNACLCHVSPRMHVCVTCHLECMFVSRVTSNACLCHVSPRMHGLCHVSPPSYVCFSCHVSPCMHVLCHVSLVRMFCVVSRCYVCLMHIGPSPTLGVARSLHVLLTIYSNDSAK